MGVTAIEPLKVVKLEKVPIKSVLIVPETGDVSWFDVWSSIPIGNAKGSVTVAAVADVNTNGCGGPPDGCAMALPLIVSWFDAFTAVVIPVIQTCSKYDCEVHVDVN